MYLDNMKKKNSVAEIKRQLKRKIANKESWNCYYCEKELNIKTATLDHIFPKSKLQYSHQKKYKKSNSVLSCRKCNLKKGDRIITCEDFRKEQMGTNYFKRESQKEELTKQQIRTKLYFYEKNLKTEIAHKPVIPKDVIFVKKVPRTHKEVIHIFFNKLLALLHAPCYIKYVSRSLKK